jgi:hypothetical protein
LEAETDGCARRKGKLAVYDLSRAKRCGWQMVGRSKLGDWRKRRLEGLASNSRLILCSESPAKWLVIERGEGSAAGVQFVLCGRHDEVVGEEAV